MKDLMKISGLTGIMAGFTLIHEAVHVAIYRGFNIGSTILVQGQSLVTMPDINALNALHLANPASYGALQQCQCLNEVVGYPIYFALAVIIIIFAFRDARKP